MPDCNKEIKLFNSKSDAELTAQTIGGTVEEVAERENNMEYNTLDELLDSKEFKNFMDELENDGFFDQFKDEEDGNTLADTGRYPE